MRRGILCAVGLSALLLVALPTLASADRPTGNSLVKSIDTYSPGLAVQRGTLPVENTASSLRVASARAAAVAAAGETIGEQRTWLALDNENGYYRKIYTLRAIGTHGEIWVASPVARSFAGFTSVGTDFQSGDCRNGVRTQVTDAQVNYLLDQFDTNIWPKEATVFSVAPDRDGTHAAALAPLAGSTYNPTGDGARTVILVDNVRDTNFKDVNNTNAFSYIAGFFSSQLNSQFDRNVMSIDAWDWLHRTGANPPNEPVAGNNCTSAPARPFLYEGTFAHEYQHLLHSYTDPDEVNWINEGLSDWAMSYTGYAHPEIPITQRGYDSHIQTFLGWTVVATPFNQNPAAAGGPENSLTRWNDQGDGETLADYGAAYSMMTYLHDHYGNAFMSALHRDPANGLAGLQDVLTQFGVAKVTADETVDNWALTVALDRLIDGGANVLGNTKESTVTSSHLDGAVNWNAPDAYSTPGAPSNGSDYVRLRDASGNYLTGGQIGSLGFTGATVLPAKPVAWTVDSAPPAGASGPALYSGVGSNRDEIIARQVAVPGGSPSLTFDAAYNEENGWDFGFAQVSTDGGVTYSSLTCTNTTTTTDPDALPTAKNNVPGFTGYSNGFKPQTCSLGAYAGQTVYLALRSYNDPATLGSPDAPVGATPGFWVDNVKVGATLLSDGSSLSGWQSYTQINPTSVSGFVVSIISVQTAPNGKSKITVKRLPLNGNFAVNGNANVQKYIDKKADFVGAVVTYHDPSETSLQYAPYQLTVNGVLQPGGA